MTATDTLLEATVVGSFSRIGFAVRSRHYDPLPSMVGKTVVVTGGTSGIGLAAARTLAALGATLVVVGRDRAKLDRAVDTVTTEGEGAAIGLGADLSLLGDVRCLGEEIAGEIGPIDVVVNNVSVLSPQYRSTADGIESTLATNLLGPFLLTNLLVPRLAERGGRVVTVSSGGMYTQPLDVAKLEPEADGYRGAVAYARTKRAQVVLTELWAQRLSGFGIVAHAMHPGWVDTPGLRSSLPGFHRLARPLLRSAEQGADTIAFLAAADPPRQTTGLFWHDRRPRRTHRLPGTRGDDAAERARLWRFLSARTGWTEPDEWRG